MLYRLLDFYYDYYRGNYVANAKNKNKVTEPYFRVYFSFLLFLPPYLPLFGFFSPLLRYLLVCCCPAGPKRFRRVFCVKFSSDLLGQLGIFLVCLVLHVCICMGVCVGVCVLSGLSLSGAGLSR